MSRPRSIYVVSMWIIFDFHFNLSLILKTDTCCITHSLEYVLFLSDNMHENASNFQILSSTE